MLQYLLSAPRQTKRLITVTYDALVIPLAIYASLGPSPWRTYNRNR